MSGNVNVVMGPMNGPNDKHPVTIIESCKILGMPLPEDAVCGKQPHEYISIRHYKRKFDDSLEKIVAAWGTNAPLIKREILESKFKAFNIKFKTQSNIKYNQRNLTVYFTDWILFAIDKGFSQNDYFDYELYNKEPDVRDTFLNEGFRRRIYSACKGKGTYKFFKNKALFNARFAKWVGREWLDASVCGYEEFKTFAEKNEKFFGKPVEGTGGEGARVIERDSYALEDLYMLCREEKLIVEEIVQQHEKLAEFNSSTLNTVRVNTLLCADGVPRITLTVARFGRSGNQVDNFHGGGVGAIVDIDTGIIITEAINRVHVRQPLHPDSKKSILGFQFPEWEKIKAAVCEAAKMIPEHRHIGWDVCVTKEGNVEFIEGNSRPNFDVLQSPDQLGRRFRYLGYIPEIEKLKGIEPKESLNLIEEEDIPKIEKDDIIDVEYRAKEIIAQMESLLEELKKLYE